MLWKCFVAMKFAAFNAISGKLILMAIEFARFIVAEYFLDSACTSGVLTSIVVISPAIQDCWSPAP